MKERKNTVTDNNGREVVNVPFYDLTQFIYYTKNKFKKDKRIVHTVITPKSNRKAYLPASATVEASIVIPLYMYAMLAVTYVIQLISIKSTMMQAMYNDVRQLCRYAYSYKALAGSDTENGKGAVSLSMAKIFLLNSLPKDFAIQSRIVGGEAGISVYGSEILVHDNEIILKVSYTVKNPFDFFGIGKIKIQQQCVSGAWLGEDDSSISNESADDTIVYITISGSVYHMDKQCSYLNPSIHNVHYSGIESQRNVSGGKYYPCERCVKDAVSDTVYITGYGERYHVDVNCSGLKRSIFSVPLSKVSEQRACSKCGGEGK